VKTSVDEIWQAKALVPGAPSKTLHPPHATKPPNLHIAIPSVPLFPNSTSLVPKGVQTKKNTGSIPKSATFIGI